MYRYKYLLVYIFKVALLLFISLSIILLHLDNLLICIRFFRIQSLFLKVGKAASLFNEKEAEQEANHAPSSEVPN